jgi:hypothetical protein
MMRPMLSAKSDLPSLIFDWLFLSCQSIPSEILNIISPQLTYKIKDSIFENSYKCNSMMEAEAAA